MKTTGIILLSLCSFLLFGEFSVNGQTVIGQTTSGSFSSISRHEVDIMIADVSTTNPSVVKMLADPEARKRQIENLKQLLAFASQAQKDGLASDPVNRQEMDNIRIETIAESYDKEINKGKPAKQPFGYIEDESIRRFWSEADREPEFQRFFGTKTALLRQSNPKMSGREVSEEERVKVRDNFARTRIYSAEYEQKLSAGALMKEFIEKANLKVKLQQAQFLARLYADKVVDQLTATDKEVAAYVKTHRGLSKKEARSKLENDKEQRLFGELIANNDIQVPDDFTLPTLPRRKD